MKISLSLWERVRVRANVFRPLTLALSPCKGRGEKLASSQNDICGIFLTHHTSVPQVLDTPFDGAQDKPFGDKAGPSTGPFDKLTTGPRTGCHKMRVLSL